MINIARHYLGSGTAGKKEILEYYNQHCFPLVPDNRKYRIKFSDDWCAAFVSVVAHKAGIRGDFPFEVSTYYQLARVKNAGNFFTGSKNAMDNDLVFFDWNGSGTPQHVGIVISVVGNILETIEGNKGDAVAMRRMVADSRFIMGYSRPPTGVDIEDEPTIEYMARQAIAGVYGNGKARRRLLGDDYDIVQERINQLLLK